MQNSAPDNPGRMGSSEGGLRGKAGHRIHNGNYQQLASEHIRDNGGSIISLAEGHSGVDVSWTATIPQWGAWTAYFKARQIPTRFMAARGREGKPWTVPAEWPHLFDMEATVQGDYEAGEYFRRNYRPPRPDLADAARRAATVAAYRSHFPKTGEG